MTLTPGVNFQKHIEQLTKRVEELERLLTIIGYHSRASKKVRYKKRRLASVYYGLTRAMCVETIDPWKQNRVRFYHPMLHDPETRLIDLPFAHAVSPLGGFDDCGANWVPPAGSTIVIMFEGGHRDAPFYLGTTWHRHRGPGGGSLIFPSREWEKVYKGHRKGYFHGPGQDPNDEDQVLPPWNTESYNGSDIDDVSQFYEDPTEQQKITYPNIYGFKTPEKHMIKMVDGDAKCNRRWKRLEIQSGCGNYFIMKDDHLHYGGQWAHPDCGHRNAGQDVGLCADVRGGGRQGPFYTDIHGQPKEKDASCNGKQQSSNILGGHTSTSGAVNTTYPDVQQGSNKFFKHQNECRPIRGPGTPQNNRLDLPQSGIQLLSYGGHTLVMDDSVEEPRGKPTWERSLEDFDFGCSDKCMAVMYLKSMTGHSIILSDVESNSKVRGPDNYIEIRSASGNRIQLNDHTIGDENCNCPPNVAGDQRGIHIESTSKHRIKLIDHLNEQCSPCRKEGGKPKAKAKQAYIEIQSGYGMQLRFDDAPNQEKTDKQYIQLLHPQCSSAGGDDNCNSCGSPECRGPHVLRMQGAPKGEPGMVFLRAGGHAIRQTYDKDIVVVGDKEKNPSDKITYVTKRFITAVEEMDFRYSGQMQVMFAEDRILLLAGRECEGEAASEGEEPPKGPCVFGVVVSKCPVRCPLTGIVHWTEKSVSERVFASANKPEC